MCENYLLSSHRDDIFRILENPDKERYFSVNVNFLDLLESDTNLANAVLTCPEESFKSLNEAVLNVQLELLKELDDRYTLKSKVTCRIYSLPPWPHVSRTIFPGNCDANKFMQITGTVVRISAKKLLEYQRQYICVKCKYPITVEAKYDKRNIIKQPKVCSNPEGCNGKNILTFGGLNTQNCKDYQEIKIQEDLSKMDVGTIPNHMIVTLDDDLVDVCKPGENVTITGIVTRRWSEFDKGVKIIIDIVLKANHVQVNNSSALSMAVSDEMKHFFNSFWERYANEPLVGRNIILRSISPTIYGLHLVKLAMAIVLAGGSQCQEDAVSTGIDTRSESHLLFVGDPGTGKSEMLRFASKIIPQSVLTTGVGSTAAGLTVAAVMEAGEWQLEGGALVMSDGGICCIDEFNSMREHDRTSIHEAMEQQSISVAKAGMVCKLKTRCSILAACNPKGNIDPSKPLCVNVAMSSPLLSRFDLILLIRDVVNEDRDRTLAEFALNKENRLNDEGTMWDLEQLQAYYALIRKRNVKLTKEAETILSTYYQLQRKFASRNKSRTTVRLLESLIRLSQGHAKLMFHRDVQVSDAVFAIALMDAAMDFQSSLLNLNLGSNSFSDNPEQLYWILLDKILGKLNLDDVYRKEMEKMGNEPLINNNNQENAETIHFNNNGLSQNRPKLLFTQQRKIQCESSSSQPGQAVVLFSQRAMFQKAQQKPSSTSCSQILSRSLNCDNNTSNNLKREAAHKKGIGKVGKVSLINSNSQENEDYEETSHRCNVINELYSQNNDVTAGHPKLLFTRSRNEVNRDNDKIPCESSSSQLAEACGLFTQRTSFQKSHQKPNNSMESTSRSQILSQSFSQDNTTNNSSTNVDRIPRKLLNQSEDSGNFSDMTNLSINKENKPEKNDPNRASTSRDLPFENKRASKAEAPHKKGSTWSRIAKNISETELDLDFDQWFDSIKSNSQDSKRISVLNNKKSKKSAKKVADSISALPSVNDEFAKYMHIDWDMEEEIQDKETSLNDPPVKLQNDETFEKEPKKSISGFSELMKQFKFKPTNKDKKTENIVDSKTHISKLDEEVDIFKTKNVSSNINHCKSSEILKISVGASCSQSKSAENGSVTTEASKGKCQESDRGSKKSKFKHIDLDLEFDSDFNPFEKKTNWKRV